MIKEKTDKENKELAIHLAYNLLWDNYTKYKRNRTENPAIKQMILDMYKERILAFQKIIIEDLKMDAKFKEIK